MSKINIPAHLKGDYLFSFIRANKSILMAQKKSQMKRADAVCYNAIPYRDNSEKSASSEQTEGILKNSTVINSCYWFDSHDDVHLPKIWNKTLKENKLLYLLQEHKLQFDKIITDELKAYTKNISWRDLGVNIDGETECLVFDNTIYVERNKFMFDQYAKGYVKNHSVGMRYVSMDIAFNSKSPDFVKERELWEKHIDFIGNRKAVEENKYFWAISEAQLIEGSAVPIGSNIITPTLESNKNTLFEPVQSTQKKPLDIQIQNQLLKLKSL